MCGTRFTKEPLRKSSELSELPALQVTYEFFVLDPRLSPNCCVKITCDDEQAANDVGTFASAIQSACDGIDRMIAHEPDASAKSHSPIIHIVIGGAQETVVNQARIRVIKEQGIIAFHAATVDIDTVPQDFLRKANNLLEGLSLIQLKLSCNHFITNEFFNEVVIA